MACPSSGMRSNDNAGIVCRDWCKKKLTTGVLKSHSNTQANTMRVFPTRGERRSKRRPTPRKMSIFSGSRRTELTIRRVSHDISRAMESRIKDKGEGKDKNDRLFSFFAL